jgi:hypothetical protein
MRYQLTDEQKKKINHFVMYSLSEVIDEELCSEYLITDDLVESDNHVEMNARKNAAIEFIKECL